MGKAGTILSELPRISNWTAAQVQFVLLLNVESPMAINGVSPSQGCIGNSGAGQQSAGVNDLKQQIEELKAKIAQQKSQGGGGSQGAGEDLEELLRKLIEQLNAQSGQQNQGAGGGGQQAGSGSGGGQIQYPSPQ